MFVIRHVFHLIIPSLIVSILFISISSCASRINVKKVPFGAVVDQENHMIMLSGAISTLDVSTRVVISGIPAGRWEIIAAPVNLSIEKIGSWEVVVEGDALLAADAMVLSRQFKEVERIKSRNALIFHKGIVKPGEPGLKKFSIEVLSGSHGDVIFQHAHSPGTVVTDEMIKNGFIIEKLETKKIIPHYIKNL